MKTAEKTHTVSIQGLSHEGRGIANIDGKTTFVAGALPSEQVDIVITRSRSQLNEAKVINVHTSSEDRVDPPCEYFGLCGGCRLQHVNTDKQIHYKQQWVSELFERIAKLSPKKWLSPLTGPSLGYRTKARLGVRYVRKKEKVLVGFRELDGRFLADMDRCLVLHPAIGDRLTVLSDLIQNLSIYREIPQLEIAVAQDAAAIIIRHLQPFTDDDLALIKRFAQESNLHIYLQPKKVSSIHQLWPENSDERLTYHLKSHDVTLRYHPSDFTQVNLDINAIMVDQAIDLLQLTTDDQVLDLFCGLGNFTLPIAKQVKNVVGVEGSQTMIDRGYENAKLNAISNVEFFAADLTQNQTASWATKHYDKILLDPPRSGAIEVFPHIKKWQPERIVYVSCNPATLARDAAELVSMGYALDSLGVMDMFPHTNHVETMALFVKV